MGPRQKPHGERLFYDSLHVRHTVEAVTVCVLACNGKTYSIVPLHKSAREPKGTVDVRESATSGAAVQFACLLHLMNPILMITESCCSDLNVHH